MSGKYIVRQPIKDAEGNAELYDLHHHAADEEDPPAV